MTPRVTGNKTCILDLLSRCLVHFIEGLMVNFAILMGVIGASMAACYSESPSNRTGQRSYETGGGGSTSDQSGRGNTKVRRENPDAQDDESQDQDTETNRGTADTTRGSATASVSLTEVRPLIRKHCIRCHGTTGSRSDLTQDAQIIARGADIVRRTASKVNGMPSDNPQAVTDEEKELLLNWKAGGYQK